jgi:hypothetical protein
MKGLFFCEVEWQLVINHKGCVSKVLTLSDPNGMVVCSFQKLQIVALATFCNTNTTGL